MSATAAGRVPSFIIGGAPRSGTTLLAHTLDRHPDVVLLKPFVPEPKVFLLPGADTPDDYRARYAAGFAEAGARTVRGEKTSYYLEHEDMPARIAATLPEVRLVFIVREPVERAYSNWLWSRQNGLETLGFADAVRCEGARASPFGPDRPYVRPFDYLARGRYATFAARYYAHFPRARVWFALYEDLERRPAAVMDELQRFLGLVPVAMDAQALGRVNAAARAGVAPLDAGLAVELRARMAPEVRRFAALTGLDTAPWGY